MRVPGSGGCGVLHAGGRVGGGRGCGGGPRAGRGRGRRPTVSVHVLREAVPHVHGPVEPRARAHPRKAVRVFGVRQVFPHQVQPDGAHEGLSRHRIVGLRVGRSASVHVQDPVGRVRVTADTRRLSER